MIYDIRLFIFQFMFDDHQKDDNDIQCIVKYMVNKSQNMRYENKN